MGRRPAKHQRRRFADMTQEPREEQTFGPFWAPVVVEREERTDGSTAKWALRVRIRRYRESEASGLAPGGSPRMVRDTLRTLIVGWRGVEDEHGFPLEFRPETLEWLIKGPLAGRIAEAVLAKASARAEDDD